jgi:hypothetical protein
MTKYSALLISPDGEDYVTDFNELHCKSIDDVWEHVNNLGSKWYYYPIIFVIKAKAFHNINDRIIAVPDGLPIELIHKSIKTAMQWIANNQDYIKAILS